MTLQRFSASRVAMAVVMERTVRSSTATCNGVSSLPEHRLPARFTTSPLSLRYGALKDSLTSPGKKVRSHVKSPPAFVRCGRVLPSSSTRRTLRHCSDVDQTTVKRGSSTNISEPVRGELIHAQTGD